MTRGRLLIRADASVAVGTGHVIRSLALAQAWHDAGGKATFAMADCAAAIERQLCAESCEVVHLSSEPGSELDGRETSRIAAECQADWVVVDGYRFGPEYQSVLKSAGLKTLFVDDYGHSVPYTADLVLNQNAGADPEWYRDREPYTRLLLGPRYCMLRREFWRWREWKREIPKIAGRILVMMGGSDPLNVTHRVLAAAAPLLSKNLEFTVVVGPSNPHLESLRAEVRKLKGITLHADPPNLAQLMAEADLAISAAGSTCWELCLMGLPTLLIDVAENQKPIARELDRLGCAVHLGGAAEVTEAKIADKAQELLASEQNRRALSARSRELVDGLGARRVISMLLDSRHLMLREARPEDARILWNWANDAQVRAASFSSAAIPWTDHVTWLLERLRSNKSLILIAERGTDGSIGQIRFETRNEHEYEVDISLEQSQRGRGFASELIMLGMQHLFECRDVARVHAFVKSANRVSEKAFKKAGFTRLGVEHVGKNEAIHLVYEKH